MWKAAFTGKKEEVGSASGRSPKDESRRKRSHSNRAESVISSTSRRDRDRDGDREKDRKRTGRTGSLYEDRPTASRYEDGSSHTSPGNSAYVTAPSSRVGEPRSLTESAVRMLPNDDDGWEDEADARSERKSKRGGEKRRKSTRSEKERSLERGDSRKESNRIVALSSDKSRENKDSNRLQRQPELVAEKSRALPEMGSMHQFPGQFPPSPAEEHEPMMSGGLPNPPPQQQFFADPPTRADSFGAAAEYYLDEGQSVAFQPGNRAHTPNMLANPDLHLHAATSSPHPVEDTGNGAAADFYSGKVSPLYSAPTTPAKPPKSSKPSSSSASKPSRPQSKPNRTSSSSIGAAALAGAGAAGITAMSNPSHHHTSSFQQTSSSTFQQSSNGGSTKPSRPSRPNSDGDAYYSAPSSFMGTYPPTLASTNGHGTPSQSQPAPSGKPPSNYNANPPLYAIGAATAGLAAYEYSQNHDQKQASQQSFQQSSQQGNGVNMSAAGGYGGGGQGTPRSPRPGAGGFGNYPQNGVGGGGGVMGMSMQQQHHYHEHKGAMSRLKDGLLNLISSPEDTAKMEMYTEYIGVCKYCFDPRTSAWDAPRVHHYHQRRDSFEDLRKRKSYDRMTRKGSSESLRRQGSTRVDKDNRYYASESSRKRRERNSNGILGAGLAAAGVGASASALFNDRKNFDDTYSVKSGHRESSAIRRRSRSSSHEGRRRSSYGVVRPGKDEYVTVRLQDGTIEHRKVARTSRSNSRDRRSGFGMAAAGAAIGAAGVAAASRRHSRSRSPTILNGTFGRPERISRRDRRSPRTSYSWDDRPQESEGIFGGFFAPSEPRRRSSREHERKRRGFFIFSNGSASSSNSELAFGEGFSNKSNASLRRKSSNASTRVGRRVTRRKSDDHIAATVTGIGATAAALAAAQRGHRINKRTSRPELGKRRDVRYSTDHPASSDDEDWEDELPSDADDQSSTDGGLAFGDYEGKRLSGRPSMESVGSQSSAGGLNAWGWRWGGKDRNRKSRRTSSPKQPYRPSVAGSLTGSAVGTSFDPSRPFEKPVYLDDTGRPLPSVDSSSSFSAPHGPSGPMQFVDPRPISDTGSNPRQRNYSMPGAFDTEPSVIRPGPGHIQHPQPISPAQPAFTQSPPDIIDGTTSRPTQMRRANSSPTRGSFVQDAALIGGAALATASILSSARKSKEPSNVRFGLTEEQQRKEDRERRKQNQKATDEERRKADRTRALKEEADRAARESREQEVRTAREAENRRRAEAELEQQRAAKKEAEERAVREKEMERARIERERLERDARERQEAAAAAAREVELHRKAREEAARQTEQRERERNEREEAYNREQARLAEDVRRQEEYQRQREAEERDRFLHEQSRLAEEAQRQEAIRHQREAEEYEQSLREREAERVEEERREKERRKSSKWGPVAAGAAAAATVGAVMAGREHERSRDRTRREDSSYYDDGPSDQLSRRRDTDWEAEEEYATRKEADEQAELDRLARERYGRNQTGVEVRDGYVTAEIKPRNEHEGEPLMDDDIFDPNHFKRKPSAPEEDPRYVEFARKAAEKVARSAGSVSPSQRTAYADFFAPKDFLSKSAESKTGSTSPHADNEIQVYHARDAAIQSHFHSPDYGYGRSKHAPHGIPKLNVISPTPPPGSENSSPETRRGKSPLAHSPLAQEQPAEVEESFKSNVSGRSERSRSISWGVDKTHVYDVETPDSHYDHNSYITSHDIHSQPHVTASASIAPHEIIVEDPSGDERRYKEDEWTRQESNFPRTNGRLGEDDDIEEVVDTPEAESRGPFRNPFFQSVSDLGLELDSPGTEGAPAVRGFIEGETDEPTPAEEKIPHIPGGFDDDEQDDIYRPRKKKSDPTPDAEEVQATPGASREPEITEEPAWEPPLTKKEKKRREKEAAKRASIAESDLPTPAVEAVPLRQTEPADEKIGDPTEYFPITKKGKKKAKQKGFADIGQSVMSEPTVEREVDDKAILSPAVSEPQLSNNTEQRRHEKDVKSGSFADVADTILAAGGIAAAAAAATMDSTEESSGSGAGKKKKKKGKKAKLGEPTYDDPRDVQPAEVPVAPEPHTSETEHIPGSWDDIDTEPKSKDSEEQPPVVDPFQYQIRNDNDPPPAAPEPPSASPEADPWTQWAEPKKTKKKSKRSSGVFNIPDVSSPLRSEVAFDDYVGNHAPAEEPTRRAESPRVNSHGRSNDTPDTFAPPIPVRNEATEDDRSRSRANSEVRHKVSETPRQISPDDSRSVASAPTPDRESRRKSRQDDHGRDVDYFDEPSYAYETRSVAASEPVDSLESSRKSKRRSRHADDDDTASVVSSRSRRDRDKEESPSAVKKEKKGGLFSGIFNRTRSVDDYKSSKDSNYDGSTLTRESTRDSKGSRDDEDDESRRRRKKKHRDSEYGQDDDDTRSVKSESRHRHHRSQSEYANDDDDARSVKSESRHRHHRSQSQYGDEDDQRSKSESRHRHHRSGTDVDDASREHRRRSTRDDGHASPARSEPGSRSHRRRDDEDDDGLSRRDSRESRGAASESGHRHHHRRRTDEDSHSSRDQSFLGIRVEDLPPLPVSRPESPGSVVDKQQRGEGSPADAEPGFGLVNDGNNENRGEVLTTEALSKEVDLPQARAPQTPSSSSLETPPRPSSLNRPVSSTAVPLRFPFGHAPQTPGSLKERAHSFSSPIGSQATPVSPVSARQTRQGRPHSNEIRPLYLVERNRQTPEVEDVLPSLPSSKPSSRASSVHGSDDNYQSAVEEFGIDTPSRPRRLTIDTAALGNYQREDILDSQETTPKASHFQQFLGTERAPKQVPQFYTWEDFARDERMHDEKEQHQSPPTVHEPFPSPEEPLTATRESVPTELPSSTRSRSKSPHAFKSMAAAAMLGTAAVYAHHKLKDRSPERLPDNQATHRHVRDEPETAISAYNYPLPVPIEQAIEEQPSSAGETLMAVDDRQEEPMSSREEPAEKPALSRKGSSKKKNKQNKKQQQQEQEASATENVTNSVPVESAPAEAETAANLTTDTSEPQAADAFFQTEQRAQEGEMGSKPVSEIVVSALPQAVVMTSGEDYPDLPPRVNNLDKFLDQEHDMGKGTVPPSAAAHTMPVHIVDEEQAPSSREREGDSSLAASAPAEAIENGQQTYDGVTPAEQSAPVNEPEIEVAPQDDAKPKLSRKQSKKDKKKQKATALLQDAATDPPATENTPVSRDSERSESIQGSVQLNDSLDKQELDSASRDAVQSESDEGKTILNIAEPHGKPEEHATATLSPLVNFGVSDFGQIVLGTGLAWHAAQADAFQSSMRELSGSREELTTRRDEPPSNDKEAVAVSQETDPDVQSTESQETTAWEAPVSKKKSKKDKKRKSVTWSEPEVEEPPTAGDLSAQSLKFTDSLSVEPAEEQATAEASEGVVLQPPVEEASPAVSKKKSKRDKKKKSQSWSEAQPSENVQPSGEEFFDKEMPREAPVNDNAPALDSTAEPSELLVSEGEPHNEEQSTDAVSTDMLAADPPEAEHFLDESSPAVAEEPAQDVTDSTSLNPPITDTHLIQDAVSKNERAFTEPIEGPQQVAKATQEPRMETETLAADQASLDEKPEETRPRPEVSQVTEEPASSSPKTKNKKSKKNRKSQVWEEPEPSNESAKQAGEVAATETPRDQAIANEPFSVADEAIAAFEPLQEQDTQSMSEAVGEEAGGATRTAEQPAIEEDGAPVSRKKSKKDRKKKTPTALDWSEDIVPRTEQAPPQEVGPQAEPASTSRQVSLGEAPLADASEYQDLTGNDVVKTNADSVETVKTPIGNDPSEQRPNPVDDAEGKNLQSSAEETGFVSTEAQQAVTEDPPKSELVPESRDQDESGVYEDAQGSREPVEQSVTGRTVTAEHATKELSIDQTVDKPVDEKSITRESDPVEAFDESLSIDSASQGEGAPKKSHSGTQPAVNAVQEDADPSSSAQETHLDASAGDFASVTIKKKTKKGKKSKQALDWTETEQTPDFRDLAADISTSELLAEKNVVENQDVPQGAEAAPNVTAHELESVVDRPGSAEFPPSVVTPAPVQSKKKGKKVKKSKQSVDLTGSEQPPNGAHELLPAESSIEEPVVEKSDGAEEPEPSRDKIADESQTNTEASCSVQEIPSEPPLSDEVLASSKKKGKKGKKNKTVDWTKAEQTSADLRDEVTADDHVSPIKMEQHEADHVEPRTEETPVAANANPSISTGDLPQTETDSLRPSITRKQSQHDKKKNRQQEQETWNEDPEVSIKPTVEEAPIEQGSEETPNQEMVSSNTQPVPTNWEESSDAHAADTSSPADDATGLENPEAKENQLALPLEEGNKQDALPPVSLGQESANHQDPSSETTENERANVHDVPRDVQSIRSPEAPFENEAPSESAGRVDHQGESNHDHSRVAEAAIVGAGALAAGAALFDDLPERNHHTSDPPDVKLATKQPADESNADSAASTAHESSVREPEGNVDSTTPQPEDTPAKPSSEQAIEYEAPLFTSTVENDHTVERESSAPVEAADDFTWTSGSKKGGKKGKKKRQSAVETPQTETDLAIEQVPSDDKTDKPNEDAPAQEANVVVSETQDDGNEDLWASTPKKKGKKGKKERHSLSATPDVQESQEPIDFVPQSNQTLTTDEANITQPNEPELPGEEIESSQPATSDDSQLATAAEQPHKELLLPSSSKKKKKDKKNKKGTHPDSQTSVLLEEPVPVEQPASEKDRDENALETGDLQADVAQTNEAAVPEGSLPTAAESQPAANEGEPTNVSLPEGGLEDNSIKNDVAEQPEVQSSIISTSPPAAVEGHVFHYLESGEDADRTILPEDPVPDSWKDSSAVEATHIAQSVVDTINPDISTPEARPTKNENVDTLTDGHHVDKREEQLEVKTVVHDLGVAKNSVPGDLLEDQEPQDGFSWTPSAKKKGKKSKKKEQSSTPAEEAPRDVKASEDVDTPVESEQPLDTREPLSEAPKPSHDTQEASVELTVSGDDDLGITSSKKKRKGKKGKASSSGLAKPAEEETPVQQLEQTQEPELGRNVQQAMEQAQEPEQLQQREQTQEAELATAPLEESADILLPDSKSSKKKRKGKKGSASSSGIATSAEEESRVKQGSQDTEQSQEPEPAQRLQQEARELEPEQTQEPVPEQLHQLEDARQSEWPREIQEVDPLETPEVSQATDISPETQRGADEPMLSTVEAQPNDEPPAEPTFDDIWADEDIVTQEDHEAVQDFMDDNSTSASASWTPSSSKKSKKGKKGKKSNVASSKQVSQSDIKPTMESYPEGSMDAATESIERPRSSEPIAAERTEQQPMQVEPFERSADTNQSAESADFKTSAEQILDKPVNEHSKSSPPPDYVIRETANASMSLETSETANIAPQPEEVVEDQESVKISKNSPMANEQSDQPSQGTVLVTAEDTNTAVGSESASANLSTNPVQPEEIADDFALSSNFSKKKGKKAKKLKDPVTSNLVEDELKPVIDEPDAAQLSKQNEETPEERASMEVEAESSERDALASKVLEADRPDEFVTPQSSNRKGKKNKKNRQATEDEFNSEDKAVDVGHEAGAIPPEQSSTTRVDIQELPEAEADDAWALPAKGKKGKKGKKAQKAFSWDEGADEAKQEQPLGALAKVPLEPGEDQFESSEPKQVEDIARADEVEPRPTDEHLHSALPSTSKHSLEDAIETPVAEETAKDQALPDTSAEVEESTLAEKVPLTWDAPETQAADEATRDSTTPSTSVGPEESTLVQTAPSRTEADVGNKPERAAYDQEKNENQVEFTRAAEEFVTPSDHPTEELEKEQETTPQEGPTVAKSVESNANDTEVVEPVVAEVPLVTKKSKKDKKKKGKQGELFVSAPVEDRPRGSESENSGSQAAAIVAAAVTLAGGVVAAETLNAQPGEEEWANISSKRSKKAKKAAKKSGISTPAFMPQEEPAATESQDWVVPQDQEIGAQNERNSDEASIIAQNVSEAQSELPIEKTEAMSEMDCSHSTIDVSGLPDNPDSTEQEIAADYGEVKPEAHEVSMEKKDVSDSADAFLLGTSDDLVRTEHPADVNVVARDGDVENPTSNVQPRSHDIDFAATVAAGLADSGFNPEMVISDPIFQRKASPPGRVAEADPDEVFSTTTTKRKKGKKGKKSSIAVDNSDEIPATPVESQALDTSAEKDFNDTLSQGLRGTGFDPALLEKASPASDNGEFSKDISEELDSSSFAVSKRKKSKKGKRALGLLEPEHGSIVTTPEENGHLKTQVPAESIPSENDVEAPLDSQAKVSAEVQSQEKTLDYRPDTSLLQQESDALEESDKPSTQTGVDILTVGHDEMDMDEMDQQYKTYRKNQRKQKKHKVTATKAENVEDTVEEPEHPATVSESEPLSRRATKSNALSQNSTLEDTTRIVAQESSEGVPQSIVQSAFPDLQRVKRRTLSTHAQDGSATEGQRPNSGKSPVSVLHTSEVSQLLPVAVSRSPPPLDAADPTSTNQDATSNGHKLEEPTWSFAALQSQSPPAAHSFHRAHEHQPFRDSGYQEAKRSSEPPQEHDANREIPVILHTKSSRDSLQQRRSLEPLRIPSPLPPPPDNSWDLQNPKHYTEDGRGRVLETHARTPSAETPLKPTSKDRASYLFNSPPEILAGLTEDAARPKAPTTPEHRSRVSPFALEASTPGHDGHQTSVDHKTHHDRSAFSPSRHLASPTPLNAIAEEHHVGKRRKADSDVGGPANIKAVQRIETPQSIRARQQQSTSPIDRPYVSIPPNAARSNSNPLSTDELINRLSWPAVDEQNDTVNIDRHLGHRLSKPALPGPRSPSVMSNRSNTSGTHFRSPQELRSFSRSSNRSETPSLRRTSRSGDLRAVTRGDSGSVVGTTAAASPKTIPFEPPPTPPPNDDDLIQGSMNDDVFQGYGDAQRSQVSPTRPPSVRKRQSMHITELESRIDQLAAENRALQDARHYAEPTNDVAYDVNGQALQEALAARDLQLREKDVEIEQIKAMLQPLQEEVARLTEINGGLTEANRNLVDDTNGRYATLQAEHAEAHQQWQSANRDLETMRQEHGRITSGMKDIIEAEIASALADKNAEILRLREQLDIAAEQIRALQVQIQSSKSSDFLVQRDEDYFDGSCQKLCQHVQQWVLRFSKLSDNRVSRLSIDLKDDKLEARLDNAILDGSDVDKLLVDRVRRRDVFMSVVMTMVWEYIFTRYLFGMDREQRQKLKALEKLLVEVGPPRAVAYWRATTLSLLSQRPTFATQCALDTEAVAHEIFETLCSLLPPPSNAEQQLLASLQKVIGIAVNLSIEMRTQRAEYIMLPPLQPDYDTNGDLVRRVHFNASLMNERSGFFSSNDELAAEHAIVKIVLFPLVVKKGDDVGEGEEEIVVCPAQVLVQNDGGRGKKVVRVMSGAMEIDDPIRSRQSKHSLVSEAPGSVNW